jgi:hypothetical protein
MNRWRIVAAATSTAALATALLAGAPAGAQEEPPDLLPITAEPPSTHSGETVTVSGEGCIVDEAAGFILVVAFNPDDETAEPFFAEGTVVEDGSWTAEVAPTADETSIFLITAGCFDDGDIGEDEDPVLFYDFVEHEVVVDETTTPPTTEPAAPAEEAPTAPVAVPVIGTPTFTG